MKLLYLTSVGGESRHLKGILKQPEAVSLKANSSAAAKSVKMEENVYLSRHPLTSSEYRHFLLHSPYRFLTARSKTQSIQEDSCRVRPAQTHKRQEIPPDDKKKDVKEMLKCMRGNSVLTM
jgi:hypothetical protein